MAYTDYLITIDGNPYQVAIKEIVSEKDISVYTPIKPENAGQIICAQNNESPHESQQNHENLKSFRPLDIKPDVKWSSLARDKAERLSAAAALADGKVVESKNAVALLEAVLRPGDLVVMEGDNQKQADFLSEALCLVDPGRVHGLHMVQPAVSLDRHLDIFEKGISSKLDFCFSGRVSERMSRLILDGTVKLGAIHTYLELYGRLFTDLTPKAALVAACLADREGNLYTGFNTEDTPILVEAACFRQGMVIAQVDQIVDRLPRVDIPGDRVDFILQSPSPFYVEPLFTRDPALISDAQILRAMLAIKGIYAEYGVQRVNHGIGFDTAAIELLLPTYGEELGLRGKVCSHFILNPHPTLIPAIESGWVESIYCFGSEIGMENYITARPDIFFLGSDGTLRSNRAYGQIAGHYAVDMFIGGTLQIDCRGNSSTATTGRMAGFGGAPNMGCDSPGRRHASPSWLKCGAESGADSCRDDSGVPRGRRLVVQMQETFRKNMAPGFVNRLDAWKVAEQAGLDLPPVMVYGDDVTHIVTEEGIAYLHMCSSLEQREAAIRAIAGLTEVGLRADPGETVELRRAGIVRTPSDLGVDVTRANRNLLAARNIRELVHWSKGLYHPPPQFRNW